MIRDALLAALVFLATYTAIGQLAQRPSQAGAQSFIRVSFDI